MGDDRKGERSLPFGLEEIIKFPMLIPIRFSPDFKYPFTSERLAKRPLLKGPFRRKIYPNLALSSGYHKAYPYEKGTERLSCNERLFQCHSNHKAYPYEKGTERDVAGSC
jgi:hypothetical protein